MRACVIMFVLTVMNLQFGLTNTYIENRYQQDQIAHSDPIYGYIKVVHNEGFNFEDKDGNKVFDSPIVDGYPMSETHFAVIDKKKKYALADKNGNFITKYSFNWLSRINNEFFAAEKTNEKNHYGKIINTKGTIVSEGRVITLTQVDSDLFIIEIYDDKMNVGHFGIINKDFKFIVKPEHHQISNKGERRFRLYRGKYSSLYTNSLNNLTSNIEIDKDLKVRSPHPYINAQNLSNFNDFATKYAGIEKEYLPEKWICNFAINYGIQKNNTEKLADNYALSKPMEMGELSFETPDGEKFRMPVFLLLESEVGNTHSKFLIGAKKGKDIFLFDQDFNEIGPLSKTDVILGASIQGSNHVAEFLANRLISSSFYNIKMLQNDQDDMLSTFSPLFGFTDLHHVFAYVDDQTYSYLQQNQFEKCRVTFFSTGVKFYREDNPSNSYLGKLSQYGNQVVVSLETYEEKITTGGYSNRIIVSRDNKIYNELPKNYNYSLFDFYTISTGIVYPVKIDGEPALLDGDFNSLSSDDNASEIVIRKNAITIKNENSDVIGLKSLTGEWLFRPLDGHVVYEESPTVFSFGSNVDNRFVENEICVYNEDKWSKMKIGGLSTIGPIGGVKDFLVTGENGLIGLLDNSGKRILPNEYESIKFIYTYYLAVKKDKDGNRLSEVYLPKENFKKLFESEYELRPDHDYFVFNEFKSRDMGLMDSSGKVLFKTKFSYLGVMDKVDLVRFTNSREPRLDGLLDMDGTIIYQQEYVGSHLRVVTYQDKVYIFFPNRDGNITVLNKKGEILDTIEQMKFGSQMPDGNEHINLRNADREVFLYSVVTKKLVKKSNK